MYSEENPNDWDRIYQRKMNSLRLRPTELNLQPVHSVTKVVEEGPTPEEGKKQSYLPSSFRLPVLFSLLNAVFIIIAINAILFFFRGCCKEAYSSQRRISNFSNRKFTEPPFYRFEKTMSSSSQFQKKSYIGSHTSTCCHTTAPAPGAYNLVERTWQHFAS